MTYLANLSLNGVTIVVGFVVTPVLLRLLGEERFGAARAAQDWLGVLTVFDATVVTGLLPLLAQAYAASDTGRLQRIFSTALSTYLKLIPAMIGIGGLLVFFLPRLVPVDPHLTNDLRLGAATGLVSFLFLPLGILKGMIDARQQGYLLHLMIGVQAVATSLFSLGFAWLDWGITGQFAAALAGQSMLATMLFVEAWLHSRDVLRSGRIAADPEISLELRNLNTYGFLSHVCSRLSLSMDSIVIAGMLEPAVVVPFLMSQRLVGFVGGQLLGIGNSAWPALAELHSNQDLKRFNDHMIGLTRLVVFLGTCLLVPTAVYTEAFVGLWVGADNFAGPMVVWMAAINSITLAVLSLWGWGICGTGNIRSTTSIQIPGTLLNVMISLGATHAWGVVGPLVGSFVNTCFHLFLIPLILRSLFGTPLGRLCTAVLAPTLCGVPFASLLGYIAQARPPRGWVELAVHLAIAPWIYFATATWLVFPAQERREWLGRLRQFFG